MKRYRYRATDKNGKIIEGTLESSSKKEGIASLKQLGLIVLDFNLAPKVRSQALTKPVLPAPPKEFYRNPDIIQESKNNLGELLQSPIVVESKKLYPTLSSSQLNLKQQHLFWSQVSLLLAGGTDILTAISLAGTNPDLTPESRSRIEEIVTKTRQGLSLTKALEESQLWTPHTISLLDVGLTSGQLNQVTAHLSLLLERLYRMRQQLIQALTYPTILLSFTLIAALGLLFLTHSLEGSSQPSYYTAIILILSGLGLSLLSLLGVSLYHKWKTPQGRYALESLFLPLPVIGRFYQTLAVVELTQYLEIMLNSGLSINHSLEYLSCSLPTLRQQKMAHSIHNDILNGSRIPIAFQYHTKQDSLGALLEVSDQTGDICQGLSFFNRAIDDTIHHQAIRVQKSLEPLLLIFLALCVLGLLVTNLAPVYTELYQYM